VTAGFPFVWFLLEKIGRRAILAASMKGRFQRTTLIVLGVVAVILLVAALLRPREPVHQGKRLSEWVDMVYTTNHFQAMGEIGQIGPNAIPGRDEGCWRQWAC